MSRTVPHPATPAAHAAPTSSPSRPARRAADLPVDFEKISLLDLARLVGNLRLSAVVTLAGALAAAASGLFWAGQEFQCSLSALALGRPFQMKIAGQATATGTSARPLILTPDTAYAAGNGTDIVLTLRQRNDDGLFDSIGQVVAQKATVRTPAELFAGVGLPLSAAWADGAFDWRNHQADNRFRERFVEPTVVHRFYDDGAILEYRVDAGGHAIAATLKWIH